MRLVHLLAVLLLPMPALAGPPLRLSGGAEMFPLIQAMQADEGLVKHVFSLALPPGPRQFVGLTGNVAFAAGEDHFAEALISVAYLNQGDCAAINNTSYSSYNDPNFPPLTRLGAFVLKSTHSGIFTFPVTVGFANAVPVAPCLVVVLDGGGAWGPGHAQPMPVAMTSFLTFLATPIPVPRPVPASVIPFGAELALPPGATDTTAVVLRANPARPGGIAIGAIFGSVAASPFDGTSGEAVPQGPWATRSQFLVYADATCTAAFAPPAGFAGPVIVHRVTLSGTGTPPGGRLLISQAPGGHDDFGTNLPFSQSFGGLVLHPGDCLVSLLGPLTALNGTIDLEQQASVVIQPLL